MNCFAFDIETVPDVELGRVLYGLEGLSDEDVAHAMVNKRMQATGGDFLPLHQHRIVAISVAYRSASGFRVWSLGEPDSGEDDIVRRFFDGLARFSPDLISWNGSGFDLPVLHYRALKHGLDASRYWEMGDSDQSFRWNNYLSRFHWRHIDLMDVLSGFQGRSRAPLDEIALMLGFPGKLGMSGSKVWDCYLQGEIGRIRDYCETDVLNTYLIYLAFERMRGNLNPAEYEAECAKVRSSLVEDGRAHLQEFLAAWEG
ncbi:MAG: 3'-5' exonuclease [Gammaproteobacteria bacterium]|nr:3'-5' exonuclease [Gammaproteobacteria bacterium]